MVSFTVLSWNIFLGLGCPSSKKGHVCTIIKGIRTNADKKTIDAIGKHIQKIKPDFCSIQEIDEGSFRNGKFDQVKRLVEVTNLDDAYFAIEKNWLQYFVVGNAVLARGTITEITSETIPYRIEKRNIIKARITKQGKTIVFLATHLGANKSNRRERMKQATYIGKIVKESLYPVILAGDLNCEPESAEFQKLIRETGLQSVISGATYPAYAPKERLDHILVSQHFKVVSAKILSIKESDHLPVVATLEL